jgi:large subunit ribosomal protein L17
MRHRKAGLKLNRTPSHRNAMFRNMVTSLLKYERIRTTGAKAKEIRRWADHLITLAKRGDLHARRQALAIVREKEVVHKLFEQADERFGAVAGGYTRVIKLGRRPGDAAPMSLVELIALQDTKKKKTKKKKTKTEGKQIKKAVDKKAPAPAEAVKTDKKEKTPAKTEVESTVKTDVAEVETKKASVKKVAAKAKDEPSTVKSEPAVGDAKVDKPVKEAKSAPETKAVTADKKDTPDSKTKKTEAKKTAEDEK